MKSVKAGAADEVNFCACKVFRDDKKFKSHPDAKSRSFLGPSLDLPPFYAFPAWVASLSAWRAMNSVLLYGLDIFHPMDGGRNRARTCDPLLVRQVLYLA